MNVEDKIKLILSEYIEGYELEIINTRHYQKITLDNEIISIFFYGTRELYFTKYFTLYFMLPPESANLLIKVFFEEVILPSLDPPYNTETYKFAGIYNPD